MQDPTSGSGCFSRERWSLVTGFCRKFSEIFWMTNKPQRFPWKRSISKAKGERVLKLPVPQQIQGFACIFKAISTHTSQGSITNQRWLLTSIVLKTFVFFENKHKESSMPEKKKLSRVALLNRTGVKETMDNLRALSKDTTFVSAYISPSSQQ